MTSHRIQEAQMNSRARSRSRSGTVWGKGVSKTLAAAAALSLAAGALAGPREQAQRMHDRIAGVPADETVLRQMTQMIENKNPLGAALLATHNRHFYTVTLKNFAAPWTNRDQSPFVPLNDYTTLVIGMVRDNLSFDQILYGDLLYHAPGVAPQPSASNNDHFAAHETRQRNPSYCPGALVLSTQQGLF